MGFQQIIIASCAFGFGLIGLTTVGDHQWLASVLHFELVSPLANSEMMAVYGGLHLGLCGFFLLAYKRTHWHLPALYLATFVLAGLAAGRVLSAIMVDLPGTLGIVLFLLEAASALGIVLCLRSLPAFNGPRE